jgi:hypothetical protein
MYLKFGDVQYTPPLPGGEDCGEGVFLFICLHSHIKYGIGLTFSPCKNKKI